MANQNELQIVLSLVGEATTKLKAAMGEVKKFRN